MEKALFRFAFALARTSLIWIGILAAGCAAQEPAWERYRVDPAGQGDAAVAQAEQRGEPDVLNAALAPEGAAPRLPPGSSRHSPRVLDPANPFSDLDVLDPYLQGVASWYGPGFHGEATANGEIYNQYGLTAAHPMLPLGTKIEVENLGNGRKVWLRVNDRGPYKKGRILDLSKLAAERLGIVDEGTAQVSIRVLRWPDGVDARLGLRAYTQFVVQVVSRPDPAAAESFRRYYARRIAGLDFRVDRPPAGQYTVIAGPYDDEGSARAAAAHLQRQGVTALVRSYRK
jgi:hypothetical protein